MKDCATKYTEIDALATELIKEIETLPAGLNTVASSKATALNQYAKQRTLSAITIDFDVKTNKVVSLIPKCFHSLTCIQAKRQKLKLLKPV